MPKLRIEPQLLETLVAAELDRAERAGERALVRDYHSLADPLYERLAPEERENAFAQIHLVWFDQRGWREWFAELWAEFPELGRAEGLLVLAARHKQDEGAVLGRDGAGVCLRALPARFADRQRLATFVRHEFLHASDMLDPAFGYRIERQDTFTEANALAERYRALWCSYVDARLARRGVEPLVSPEARLRELKRAFPALAVEQLAALSAQEPNVALTHADLMELARQIPDSSDPAPRPGTRCPLCRFPTFEWAKEIAPETVNAIQSDFRGWNVRQGACARCVERYELCQA